MSAGAGAAESKQQHDVVPTVSKEIDKRNKKPVANEPNPEEEEEAAEQSAKVELLRLIDAEPGKFNRVLMYRSPMERLLLSNQTYSEQLQWWHTALEWHDQNYKQTFAKTHRSVLSNKMGYNLENVPDAIAVCTLLCVLKVPLVTCLRVCVCSC